MLPPNPASYISDWLFDIGPTGSNAGGECELSYRDLVAWQEISGIELFPWEAKLIRHLSSEFADERYKARKRDRIAPYTGTARDIESNRQQVARKIAEMFNPGKTVGKGRKKG